MRDRKAAWATKQLRAMKKVEISELLLILQGRGIIFLTKQTGKERAPRCHGFIKTMWTVRDTVHASRRKESERKSVLDLLVHS